MVYSKQINVTFFQDYSFVVTATDGAIDKRLGTASVTVQVQDEPDESPTFSQPLYTVHVPENVPNHPVVKVHVSIKYNFNNLY